MKRPSFFTPLHPPVPRAPRAAPPAPSFAQWTRCDWGTHVTVLEQPARFIQAGQARGRRLVVVAAADGNAALAGRCVRREPMDDGESAYYLGYHEAALRLGLPAGVPLLPDQAASCLRMGDRLLVGDEAAVFIALKWRGHRLWLLLRTAAGILWGLPWSAASPPIRLQSALLPTFRQLRELDSGTPVTLGARATPARLCGTFVEDGTREFVVTRAMGPGVPAPDRRVMRFQEAGLRLVPPA